MVATRSARAFTRAAAAIFTLVFLTSGIPLAGAQTEQVTDQVDPDPAGRIFLRQGEVEFHQDALGSSWAITSPFVTNDNTATAIRVPVYNTGVPTNNVPVYFWINDAKYPDLKRGDCTVVNLETGAQTSVGRAAASAFAYGNLTTNDLEANGYNVSVRVGGTKPSAITKTCTGTAPLNAEPDAINGYFVKGATLDLRITGFKWCQGIPSPRVSCVEMTSGAYNVSQTTGVRTSFFEFEVENHGSWANMSDYGGPRASQDDGFRIPVNVTIRGPFIASAQFATNLSSNVFQLRSKAWDFVNLAGDYNVTAKIDTIGALRGATPQHTSQHTFNIGYRDLASTILPAGLKTSPTDPYPATGGFRVTGNVVFSNLGRQEFENTARVTGTQEIDETRNVKWRLFIVNETRPFQQERYFNMSGGNVTISGYGSWDVAFDWPASTTPGDENYLSPGKHTIRAEIDSVNGTWTSANFGAGANVTFELEEGNNNHTLDIYVGGAGGPAFTTPTPKLSLGGIGEAPLIAVRPYEQINIYANVSHADPGHLTVVANFTRADNASIYREVPLKRWDPGPLPERFSNFVTDFNATNGTGGEAWNMRVTATDVFGRSANSSIVSFYLAPWDIENATREWVLVSVPDNQDITWASTDQPTFQIRVMANATGIADQRTNVTNLGFDITTPKNRTYSTEGGWSPRTDCQSTGIGGLGDVVCTDADQFRKVFIKGSDDGGPGRWNYTVRVRDRANITHAFNGTFLIVDELPQIKEHALSPSVLDPGDNITVRVNATDDFSVKAAYVNFTRTTPNDGLVVNITLPAAEIATGTVPSVYMFNDTIRTGRGERFGVAGTYSAKLWVVDENDNWNWSSFGTFILNDTDQPALVDATVTPAVQELGANVTFSTKVRDTTNVSVKLQVLKLSEEVFPAVQMVEGPDGSYSYTTNFTTEDTFDWVMTATDSTGRASEVKRGTLTIRSNVGPRFDIRSPATVIDSARFGSATPRIEVVTHDTEAVIRGSIEMRVGGILVQPDIVNATGSQGGFIVSYAVPATKKFSHRDVVDVNLTAIDNSSENIPNWLNFSFTVDDVAPVARIVSISPGYRDQPSQPLNISLSSRITLAADDNDAVPTNAEAIRFRILGGGNNAAETTYNGPFRITDAPGVYTGPRLYQIQFWAEDSVGNFNRNFNVTTVFVDDTPPALFQFFPQGRQINATFVDDVVGVNRSVAWYRVNNEPYTPLPLVEDAGTWSILLPEGKKGDRISYYLQVWDRLDNTDTFGNATAPYASFDVSNHEPKVRIKTPTDGARLGRTVDLMWDASDEDNDALVFTIYYKAPGRQSFVELARIENNDARRYAIDTNRFPDGQYTLRVAASDGGFVKLSDVTVTILNRGSAVGAVSVDGGTLPGETALVTAEITKAQATVEARLYLGGEFVDAYPMNDDGVEGDAAAGDNVYSARVPISSAGDYSVEIFSRYQEDGELKESTLAQAATFSAKLTPGYILAEYAALLVVIAVLALVGIGVAAFVVIRRR